MNLSIQSEVPSLGPYVIGIDLRLSCAINGRKFLPFRKNALGVTDIHISSKCKSVLQKSKVETDILGNDSLPRS